MSSRYNVIVTPQAQNDVALSCSYIARELYAVDAAIKLADEFYSSIVRLEEYPLSCPLLQHPFVANKNIRKLVVNKSYVALYTVREIEKCVYVIGVFHTSRDYVRHIIDYNIL